MAISLVSTKFGSGLQVDRQASTNTRNVYVPQAPVKTRGEGHYPIYQSQPLFWKLGKSNWSWGKMGRGLLLGKNSPFSSIPIIGSFWKQPLSNFDLFDWAKKKKTWNKIFQGYFQQRYITKKDWKRVWNSQSRWYSRFWNTHWVCYRKFGKWFSWILWPIWFDYATWHLSLFNFTWKKR